MTHELIPQSCPRCWGHGQRGMDHCYTCGGTGSVFEIGPTLYPNTEHGHRWAMSEMAKNEAGNEAKIQRFIEAARAAGADETTGEAFERAAEKIIRPRSKIGDSS